MSHDTQVAPAQSARQLAHFFGQIADTTEWNHACWQGLFARLLGAGKTPAELTLGEIQTAIDQVVTRWADCQGTGPRALS
ncbi:hypothetical protein [Stenotrophomonas sp. NY11291]|uniref:hypothetical protein n=1 Tax=Stenotrophomonas sp. NY11291 TaxID=2939415 RepID=UPI00200FF210|nr:hypothetical protein [Stenotrophomonas sp. NY11291]UQA22130.1 hypothetical protein M1L61_20520 [Stenotrophomonas sp. NY11291]